jgi:hypothetical protein
MIISFNSRASEAWGGPREGGSFAGTVRLGRGLQVRVRVIKGLRRQVRLGRARKWKRRALRVRIRLGRACKRAEKAL